MPHDELLAKLAELYENGTDRENIIDALVEILHWCDETGNVEAELVMSAHIYHMNETAEATQ